MTYVETANWGARTRHYALAESMRPWEISGGRAGYPLCSENHLTWDQEAIDNNRKRWTDTPAKRLSDLPLCKKCERKAAQP